MKFYISVYDFTENDLRTATVTDGEGVKLTLSHPETPSLIIDIVPGKPVTIEADPE